MRLELISGIIIEASLNSNQPPPAINSNELKLKASSWNKQLANIPLGYLNDLYAYSEGFKKHSSMITPGDMIKAWAEYRNKLRQQPDRSKSMTPGEAQSMLDKVHTTIGYSEQRDLFRKIISKKEGWDQKYKTGGYVPTDECCGQDKLPMYLFIKNGVTKCVWCLADKMGLS